MNKTFWSRFSRQLSTTRRSSLPRSISPHQLVEEESLESYKAHEYYPVRIGDVLDSNYRVIGKLGYGAYSTVWLCRDLRKKRYVSVKVSTALQKVPRWTLRELKVYEQLGTLNSSHKGQSYIRSLYASFNLPGAHGNHSCLVQQPMLSSLHDSIKLSDGTTHPLDPPVLKEVLKCLLKALDFLHSEAKIIHADIKADNLMLDVHDQSVFEIFEKNEQQHPIPRKVIDERRVIYLSRKLPLPTSGEWGLPILCDFGEARIGKLHETGPFVQPHIYRAPEVIAQIPWGPPIDIWNVATMIWDLLEGKRLFSDIIDEDGQYDAFKHFAQMVALIGPPSAEFIARSETLAQCFDPSGEWVAYEHALVPTTTLEDVVTRLEGEDKALFLRFIRSMLRWQPEERMTAKQLLEDPWLNRD